METLAAIIGLGLFACPEAVGSIWCSSSSAAPRGISTILFGSDIEMPRASPQLHLRLTCSPIHLALHIYLWIGFSPGLGTVALDCVPKCTLSIILRPPVGFALPPQPAIPPRQGIGRLPQCARIEKRNTHGGAQNIPF